jgi:hypothetical protein
MRVHNGSRVKSVMGTETTVFPSTSSGRRIGGYFEVTNPGAGQTVTKYYFAGATRVAMMKYVVLRWLYTATQPVPVGTDVFIEVTATCHSGKQVTMTENPTVGAEE